MPPALALVLAAGAGEPGGGRLRPNARREHTGSSAADFAAGFVAK